MLLLEETTITHSKRRKISQKKRSKYVHKKSEFLQKIKSFLVSLFAFIMYFPTGSLNYYISFFAFKHIKISLQQRCHIFNDYMQNICACTQWLDALNLNRRPPKKLLPSYYHKMMLFHTQYIHLNSNYHQPPTYSLLNESLQKAYMEFLFARSTGDFFFEREKIYENCIWCSVEKYLFEKVDKSIPTSLFLSIFFVVVVLVGIHNTGTFVI